MTLAFLPDATLTGAVRAALAEDLGCAGDITSQALIPAELMWKGELVARASGVIAGMDFARLSFALIDAQTRFEPLSRDGQFVRAGEPLARVSGKARSLLAAERTALNFLSHLSGIASATAKMVEAVGPHKAKICCTRKTVPGLRAAEKYAVRAGGGVNHRFGLDDGMLIKDNHIAALGDIRAAILKAREAAGHMVKIEIEVDALEQLEKILDLPVDAVLLDNMKPETLAQAVKLVDGKFVTEASGGVTLENVQAIAASGVDLISVGSITNSAPALDIALDAG